MANSKLDPKDIRFTTASILVSFETSPLKDMHMDKIVDLLLSENWPSCNCPILPVVRYDNAFWSLHNQWLWVYRRAKFSQVDALVLDAPESESHDAFLASAKTPDVARFLALLKKPEEMARMKSELFFPAIDGEWKIHHSEELINAIRIRPAGSLSSARSMRPPLRPLPKPRAPADPQPVQRRRPDPELRAPEPASSPSPRVPPVQTSSVSELGFHAASSHPASPPPATADSAKENAAVIEQGAEIASSQGNLPSGQCNVESSLCTAGIVSQLEVQAAVELEGHLPEDEACAGLQSPGGAHRPSDSADNAGRSLGSAPDDLQTNSMSASFTALKTLPDKDDCCYSDAILDAMSTAAMHGLTFSVTIPPAATIVPNISSTMSGDALPAATPTASSS